MQVYKSIYLFFVQDRWSQCLGYGWWSQLKGQVLAGRHLLLSSSWIFRQQLCSLRPPYQLFHHCHSSRTPGSWACSSLPPSHVNSAISASVTLGFWTLPPKGFQSQREPTFFYGAERKPKRKPNKEPLLCFMCLSGIQTKAQSTLFFWVS